MPLAPTAPSKPVILVGGLNGGGKTSFLDAIQLSLFGKRARCSNRGSLAYEEYLRRCINRGVAETDGAAVELQFRHRSEAKDHTYRVHRSWSVNKTGVTERVQVLRDGTLDRVLTDEWNEVVEEFIPAGISHLYFFDGEKIEAFADMENSARLLNSAVQALLGLDIVDRLITDLQVLEGRQRSIVRSDADKQRLEVAEAAWREAEERRIQAVNETRPAKQRLIDDLKKGLRAAEERYAADGGHLLDDLRRLESEKLELERLLSECTQRMKELAAGPAPFVLVKDLLLTGLAQAEAEEQGMRIAALGNILIERDTHILRVISKHKVPQSAVKALKVFLESDRRERATPVVPDSYLNLTQEGHDLLHRLVHSSLLNEVKTEILHLLEEMERLHSRLTDAERKLSGVPDAESLAPLVDEINKHHIALKDEQVYLAALDIEIERLTRERDSKKQAWINEAERILDAKLKHEDANRILVHSARVRRTLEDFKKKVVRRHVSKIEELILDSFRQLLRKKSLIAELHIDPDHFTLELRGRDGQVISPDRLSAGERQLMAVSLLWGLARASGRPLPTVIDTPLGRLDSSHRINLIERYFPYASHQVLLLSTDEEIDETLFTKLKPWISRTYRLDFDDKIGITSPNSGYFW